MVGVRLLERARDQSKVKGDGVVPVNESMLDARNPKLREVSPCACLIQVACLPTQPTDADRFPTKSTTTADYHWPRRTSYD